MHPLFRVGLSCLLTALAVNAQAFVQLDSGPRFRYLGDVSAVSTGACDIVVEIVAARMEGPNAIVQRTKGRLYLPKADESVDRDAAGRLTVDSRWDYTWNLRGELLSAESKHRSPNVQLTYSYYPSGPMARREKREWVNDDWALVSTTRWIVDGWRPVKEIEARVGGDTIERVYTWGLDLSGWQDRRSLEESGGIGGLLAVREKVNGGSETTYYVLGDPMGNVMALATGDGTIAAEYDYDPYGRLIRETGASAATCPFRYSTKYRDPDLELYYYGHRWYDAAALKWLTPDPIGERGGVNLTAFCDGDPINKVDPLGLDPWEDFKADYMTTEAWKYRGKVFVGTFVGASKVLYGVGDTFYSMTGGAMYFYSGGRWTSYRDLAERGANIAGGILTFVAHPIKTTSEGVANWQENMAAAMLEGEGLQVGEGVGSLTMQGLVVGETIVNPGARLLSKAPGTAGAIGRVLTTPIKATPGGATAPATIAPKITSGTSHSRFLEYKTLRSQGYNASEAHGWMKQFDAGANPGDNFLFHFASEGKATFSLANGIPRTDYGFGVWRGVYTGTTPTPNWFLKNTSPLGWGITSQQSVRMPLLVGHDMNVANPLFRFPLKTIIIRTEGNLPLSP
ncbi:MAG: RHS repeat-associated core domain-containing protein [Desulfuromonadales bacterium]|nr:RHS repeat-associated core domain-containing protein [Desulfuromonadales bacterium]